MLITILLLLVGFVLLIKGADWLVSGASSLAKRYGVRELVIGLTIVAFGTSAPELSVNILAAQQGLDAVVFGNIIGSNIFNLLAILAIAGIICPLVVERNTVWREIPYSLLAVVVLYLLINDGLWLHSANNDLSRIDGFILLGFFAAFMAYIFYAMRQDPVQNNEEVAIVSTTRTFLYIAVGLVGLVIGGKMVVDNAIIIAQAFQMSEKMIGLTIVAAGTSLPELATSAMAAYRGKSDLAIGNVIGSNIFNIFLVLGISAAVKPLQFDLQMNTDLWVLTGGTLFLLVAMFTGKAKQLDRWEAVVLLIAFVAYSIYLFIRN